MRNVPAAIEECEKIGLTTSCATRHRKREAFDARWRDGSIGRVTMQKIPRHVVLEREDDSGLRLAWALPTTAFFLWIKLRTDPRAVDGSKGEIGNVNSYISLSVQTHNKLSNNMRYQ